MSIALYRPIAHLAHRVLPFWRGKLAEALAGRRGATGRWMAWAATLPVPRALVWVHAASAGEWLAAAPVIRRLKAARADLTIALTYSSPSLAGWPRPADVDRADYVPPDEPGPMRAVYEGLDPAMVLVSRGDLWPELLAAAHHRAVPVAVIGGAISPQSRRLAWPWRRLLRDLYRPIAYIGAITPADRERFERLGVPAAVTDITGDPRHDQVVERIANLAAITPLITWGAGQPVLVAGSTHASDEAVVLDAFAQVRRGRPDARLALVPHEPGPAAAERIGAMTRRFGLQMASWPGSADLGDASMVAVQTMGHLADLYACAQLAYVGGGFQPAGVHAGVEPAVYGLPVVFGPVWSKSEDARRLLAAGGAASLPSRGAADAFARLWTAWLHDSAARIGVGLRARRTVTPGAATATANAVLRQVLERCSLRTSPTGEPPNRP